VVKRAVDFLWGFGAVAASDYTRCHHLTDVVSVGIVEVTCQVENQFYDTCNKTG
jgi:hypothetical protein